MKKWIGNLLIVTSAAMLVWLLTGNFKVQNDQEEIIKAFAEVKGSADVVQAEKLDTTGTEIVNKKNLPPNVEGILTIPSIDMKAPVMRGASPENLDRALGSINGLDEPGVVDGSYAIAGHRSHVFGTFFNRLDELQAGDRFSYETMKETFTFEVFDTKVVKPSEVESLRPQKGIALLSLITCYPENSNTYRLVVYGKRID